jgi:hypothetical protein
MKMSSNLKSGDRLKVMNSVIILEINLKKVKTLNIFYYLKEN